MPWPVIATLGDVSIAILACAGLLFGVWVMARGARSEPGAAVAPARAPAPAVPAPPPGAPDAPQPTTFRQGAIRLGGETSAEPEPATASEDEPPGPPSQPAASAPPEFPPTDFRQGRIRVGGLERGWKRDS